MTSNSFQTMIASRFGIVIFLFGKLFRFAMTLAFIYFLFSGTRGVLGFNRDQTLLFLLTFIFLGGVGQMFFREAYRFRARLVSGDFDFDLLKPIHPLFRNLAGGFDFLDLLTMPIYIYVLIQLISQLRFSLWALVLYLILLINGFVIIMAIHILVVGLGIITTEVDHLVMVYRDIESMGRFPVDIYKEPLRQFLTFVVPIGLMFTFPAKALLGLLSWQAIIFALVGGGISLFLCLKFWDYAVKNYSSASS